MESTENTAEQDPYKVTLEVFEGPLDLLLHLIKKEDLNIYDIPIARLLKEYMQYIDLAKELNVDLAGEFIEMASELAYIKSKTLLPEPEEEEAPEGPDPRAELVRRLIEYRRYKDAAQSLMTRPLLGTHVFARPPSESEAEAEMAVEADTLSLVAAFQDLLKRLPTDQMHEIRQPRMGVSERIMELTETLRGKERVPFEDLFEGETGRPDLIVTFLAILEMAKQRLLRILQERVFHRIFINPLIGEAGGPHESAGSSGT